MQRSIEYFTFVILFIARASAQTTGTGAINPSTPAPSVISSTAISSPPRVTPTLSLFSSQREEQAARVTALRHDIAALETQLIDPRTALRVTIEAMTRIEGQLISAFVEAPGDSEFAHSIEPFVSDLVRMRSARMRQLAAVEASGPVDAEKIRRQWLNKQDELRTAEMLLGGIEKQLDTLRADRELDRRAQDLSDLTKTIPASSVPTAAPAFEGAPRPISKP